MTVPCEITFRHVERRAAEFEDDALLARVPLERPADFLRAGERQQGEALVSDEPSRQRVLAGQHAERPRGQVRLGEEFADQERADRRPRRRS